MKSSSTRHILNTILLILAISFIIDKFVFHILNKVSDNVYSGQAIGKLNHYLKIKDNLDLVIYGSSRANRNINSEVISLNSFNIGMDGTMMACSAALIKLLPEHKSQTIILHIAPENAFKDNYVGKDILALNSKYYRNKLIKNEIDNIGQNNILQKFYWGLSYNGKVIRTLKNYLKPKYDYTKYFGYDPIKVNKEQKKIVLKKLQKEKEKDLDCSNSYHINNLYNEYLNEIKEFCYHNNKKLILFTSPRYVDSCKNDNKLLNQILKDKDILYYDLTDVFNKNNKIEFWKDEIHLSDKGAEIFTLKLKNILDNNKRKPNKDV